MAVVAIIEGEHNSRCGSAAGATSRRSRILILAPAWRTQDYAVL